MKFKPYGFGLLDLNGLPLKSISFSMLILLNILADLEACSFKITYNFTHITSEDKEQSSDH
jgi:hypothetical protein